VDRQVIEEKEGLGTMNEHVIDIHGNQVNADGVQPLHLAGNQDFGPYAVRTGDQNRVFVIFFESFCVGIQPNQAGKAVFKRNDTGAEGGSQGTADSPYHLIVGINTHAGLLISDFFGRAHLKFRFVE